MDSKVTAVVTVVLIVLLSVIIIFLPFTFLTKILVLALGTSVFVLVLWGSQLFKSSSRITLTPAHKDDKWIDKLTYLSKSLLEQEKLYDWSVPLTDFFKSLLSPQRYVIFLKKERGFETVLSYNLNYPLGHIFYLKNHHPLASLLLSYDKPVATDQISYSDIPSGLRPVWEQFAEGYLVSIKIDDKLSGFILFNTTAAVEEKLNKKVLNLAFGLLALGFKMEKARLSLNQFQKKMKARLKQAQTESFTLDRELKKKILDFQTLFQLTHNLFSILDEERLFNTLTSTLHSQLEAKSILIMLKDEKNEFLINKFAKGVNPKDLPGLFFLVDGEFHNFIKTKTTPLYLSNIAQKLPHEATLKTLLALKMQLCCKLALGSDTFALVFLGEKSTSTKYKPVDLEIASLILEMGSIAFQNIKQFKRIEELSYIDSMSGLYNYRYFYKRLTEEIFRAKRFVRSLALVIFDIDEFKVYNDSYGHQAGDAVLRQLGQLLLSTVRSIDVVSRYGGEEFCIIMPETNADECSKFMERLRKSIAAHPFKDEYSGNSHNITISVGGAIYPQDAKVADRLIYCADMALLKAKSSGKNKSCLYLEENQEVREKIR